MIGSGEAMNARKSGVLGGRDKREGEAGGVSVEMGILET